MNCEFFSRDRKLNMFVRIIIKGCPQIMQIRQRACLYVKSHNLTSNKCKHFKFRILAINIVNFVNIYMSFCCITKGYIYYVWLRNSIMLFIFIFVLCFCIKKWYLLFFINFSFNMEKVKKNNYQVFIIHFYDCLSKTCS